MDEQITLYAVGNPDNKTDNVKRRWENGFQRWSNKQSQDETTATGICGNSPICDYCTVNTYGRPCVRALNEMCREKRITINYDTQAYEDAWEGYFDDRT